MSLMTEQKIHRPPQLPPLILHPFSGGNGVDDLLEGSRASLALQGLLESTEEQSVLLRRMLLGRYQEVRMLVFLGKDIFRWLQQCVESVSGKAGDEQRVTEQSFAALVVEDPPETVRRKLEGWGVTDRRAVFSRAIGIHSLFEDPPPLETLSPIFLKNYHRFADHAYICFQHLEAFQPLDTRRFEFEIYASEEYARLLSSQWEDA
jgi:hypothetical protein